MSVNETVLAYISDEVASIPQPIKKLVAVDKTELKSGETKTACLTVSKDQLMITDISMNKILEPGWFTVTVGGLSERIYIK